MSYGAPIQRMAYPVVNTVRQVLPWNWGYYYSPKAHAMHNARQGINRDTHMAGATVVMGTSHSKSGHRMQSNYGRPVVGTWDGDGVIISVGNWRTH